MWSSFFILAAITTMTILGDYCIKLATHRDTGLRSAWFLFGALLYGLPAIGWFFLMKSHSLAMIGVMYSGATLILLTMLGYVMFNEKLGLREILGLSLAIAAVIVMSRD